MHSKSNLPNLIDAVPLNPEINRPYIRISYTFTFHPLTLSLLALNLYTCFAALHSYFGFIHRPYSTSRELKSVGTSSTKNPVCHSVTYEVWSDESDT